MDVFVLSQTIYWLFGAFVLLIALVTVWEAYAGAQIFAMVGPVNSCVVYGGCLCMIASVVNPIIWTAISILGGFFLYAVGETILVSVIVAILCIAAYKLVYFIVNWVVSFLIYVSMSIYYRIREIRIKRRNRKRHESKKK